MGETKVLYFLNANTVAESMHDMAVDDLAAKILKSVMDV